MKARVAVACLLTALLVSCEPYDRSNSGVSATEKTLFYDFRDTSRPAPPKVDAAIQRKLLLAVARDRGCAKEEARINAVSEGSFTAAGVKQTAYLTNLRCLGTPPQTLHRLLIFTGDKLEANAEVAESSILKTCDLNGDGENELLLAFRSEKEPVTNVQARLVQFDKMSLVAVENFGIVYDDTCGSADSRGLDAVVLSYLPRPGQKMPNFTAQRFRAECPGPDQGPHWTLINR